MKSENFEKELPITHKQIIHVNAKDVKFGLIFNAISFGVLLIFIFVAHISLTLNKEKANLVAEKLWSEPFSFPCYLLILMLAIYVYVILHELTHGLFYKVSTGERLTFGISWSCAFCGVPKIFVYRKAALKAVCAPLAIFTVILIPLTVLFYFTNPVLYVLFMVVSGLHLGGCSGDFYVACLFIFKLRNPYTLMRDTGPEQFFYVPYEAAE